MHWDAGYAVTQASCSVFFADAYARRRLPKRLRDSSTRSE
jgi:hypothetical protein